MNGFNQFPQSAGASGDSGPRTTPAAPSPPNYIRPNFERMPAELKQLRNWLLWVPHWTGSKWTKVPIQASGYGASTTNPAHWNSFDAVRQAYELAEHRGYMEYRQKSEPPRNVPIGGVGFVFDGCPDQDGLVYAGIDFDHAISAEGNITSLAGERIRRLGSYFETSVSGRGLHGIVKARPLAGGIAHNGVEMYTAGRYFTMTGSTSGTGAIVSAEREFDALAQELRDAKSGDSKGAGARQLGSFPPKPSSSVINELGAGIEAGWFEQLPHEKRSEAVRYAALHIATHSSSFELTRHGGNHQDYVRLGFAIARSGVANAEDIFVEAASKAKDADPEQQLRDWFKNCQEAHSRPNSVTVGTLFHMASQCGADLTPWKVIANTAGAPQQSAPAINPPDDTAQVAVYAPGNTEQCRKLLDEIVAADARTFTLGDPAGPLVILRVPDEDTVPPATRWEGDLPGATLATPADIMQRAERLIWQVPKGTKLVRSHPPRQFVADYLAQVRGQYGAPPLRGIVRVPHIDDHGAIRFVSGYDGQTGLFHDGSPVFDVPPNPSAEEARKAAQALLLPFSKYKFENDAAGQALILAAIFTAIERPFLSVAPMFVVRSSMPGTGKGLIVRSLVRLAFNTAPVVITWGGTGEEFEKRFAALLLQAPGALSIDNANGMLVQGDLLEAFITEGCADIRPLGRSEMVKVRSRSFITLTGNNPIITGDMARRTLVLDILPKSADPERDQYDFHPVEVIRGRRPDFLRAAYTIMRAFRCAGMPAQGLPAVGSFDEWSRKVRDLVHWLQGYDISEAFRRNKEEDPRRQSDAELLSALHDQWGSAQFKSNEVIAVYEKVAGCAARQGLPVTEQALHAAIDEVLGGGNRVNVRTFGNWARRVKGAYYGDLVLHARSGGHTKTSEYIIRQK